MIGVSATEWTGVGLGAVVGFALWRWSAARMVMYEDYVAMRVQAFNYGMHALALIRAYAEGGARAAQAISSQAAARSARSQGSE